MSLVDDPIKGDVAGVEEPPERAAIRPPITAAIIMSKRTRKPMIYLRRLLFLGGGEAGFLKELGGMASYSAGLNAMVLAIELWLPTP